MLGEFHVYFIIAIGKAVTLIIFTIPGNVVQLMAVERGTGDGNLHSKYKVNKMRGLLLKISCAGSKIAYNVCKAFS